MSASSSNPSAVVVSLPAPIEKSFASHPHFKEWIDPGSKIRSFVLSSRVAPVQQGFYFVNSGVSSDDRLLWFYCAYPPGRAHTLGVVSLDPADPFIRHFPGAQFDAESPLLTPDGRGCYFVCKNDVWLQHIESEQPTLIFSLSPDFIAGRELRRMVTHLTRSCDGRWLLLDVDIGNEWSVLLVDMNDPVALPRVLKHFGRKYNHAQFSSHDPNLFLIAQDWWKDSVTGKFYNFDQRTWLMTVDQTRFEPVLAQGWFQHTGDACHEWWAADGTLCWTDYKRGAMEMISANSPEAINVWGPRPLCHAQCDATRQFWVGDESPYKWAKQPCEVLFYDRATRREIAIASALPKPPLERGWFHLDPHPHFSPSGRWVIYTTTVFGRVDVAIASVDELRAAVTSRGRPIPAIV